MTAIYQQLGAAFVEHAIERAAKGFQGIERRIGDERMQGHGSVAGGEVGTPALEIQQAIHYR